MFSQKTTNTMWNSDNNQRTNQSSHQNGNATKSFGMTSAISTAEPKPEDIQATDDLKRTLQNFNVFETEAELNHRMSILAKLNTLAITFIKDLSINQNVPVDTAHQLGGRIQTFGSYRLGVHSPGADIDALCVAPRNVTRDEFFTLFTEVLKKHPEVTECRAIEEAFVPVVKMNFDGIEIDLLFARMALKEIPEDFDLSEDNLLKNLDQKCVRSLNGCRVTDEILRLVPNHESYRLALRAIKLWAKKRGIYSNSLGYFGGVSWAMLVARTCQLYPNAAAATIVNKFFLVFSRWVWPNPVLLKPLDNAGLGFTVWDPRTSVADRYHLMPIITPAYPQQNSTFNVSSSTRRVIEIEFERGLEMTEEITRSKLAWDKLFEDPLFFYKYRHFLVLLVCSQTAEDHLEWCGLVESKVRYLIGNLERNPHISLAHVNPRCFDRPKGTTSPATSAANGNAMEANDKFYTAAFCSMWFIGMDFKKSENLNVDLTDNIHNFTNLGHRHASTSNLQKEGMEIEVKHVRRKQLSTFLDKETLDRERKLAQVEATSPAVANKAVAGKRKRVSTEVPADIKKACVGSLDGSPSPTRTDNLSSLDISKPIDGDCDEITSSSSLPASPSSQQQQQQQKSQQQQQHTSITTATACS